MKTDELLLEYEILKKVFERQEAELSWAKNIINNISEGKYPSLHEQYHHGKEVGRKEAIEEIAASKPKPKPRASRAKPTKTEVASKWTPADVVGFDPEPVIAAKKSLVDKYLYEPDERKYIPHLSWLTFNVFKVSKNTPIVELNKKKKALLNKCHPDKIKDPVLNLLFQEVTDSYEVIERYYRAN